MNSSICAVCVLYTDFNETSNPLLIINLLTSRLSLANRYEQRLISDVFNL